MNKNSVKYLQGIHFQQITLAKETDIKNLGCRTPERCFSTMKRVKTFSRSTMSQDRPCALAMLSVEKVMIENTTYFSAELIDEPANRKERQMDILYK
jgi:hypothetical protein